MKNILDNSVLVLNSGWQAISFCTMQKALERMNSSKSPRKALKIEYWKNEDGTYDFDKITEMIPLAWEEWIDLPLREFEEECIRTPKSEIRPIRTIICTKYSRMPIKTFRATKRNIYEASNGKDYWTGEDLPFKQATLDHLHPRSKGGGNTWTNLAITSSKVNRLKNDMSVKEFEEKHGYKPHYKLKEPKPVPATLLIKEALFHDWRPFLLNNAKHE